MNILVICEKNSAASRISYLLSDGDLKKKYYYRIPHFQFPKDEDNYYVIGLRGHIVEYDYPEKYNNWSKVDEEDLIQVEPEKSITESRIVALLTKLGGEVDRAIVATDYDREGELIGLEAVRLLLVENPNVEVKRAKFSSLSKSEVSRAFENLTDVDENLAESAETRQIVDLAWGAVLTRFLSKTAGQYGRDFISAGRVQSPTLALIVDREMEIEDFEPEAYWQVTAELEKDITFKANYEEERIWDEERAENIFELVEDAKSAKTLTFNEETEDKWPWPPFNTTQFLSEATKLGISPAQAMKTAENLYTRGWISYPRTENTVYPSSLNLRYHLEKLKDSELSEEIEEILQQKKIRPSRGKKQTTDHPPIYPIKAATKKDLKGRDWKVYELILRRFMATVSPPGKGRKRDAEFDIQGEKFISKGYEIIEQGWMKYYPYYKPRETFMPPLEVDELVDVVGVDFTEDETKPPNRYSQGALIREMEKKGLGTKSTRHEIIQKLYDRGFISGKTPRPTLSGKSVIKTLEDHADNVAKPEMTKTLEEDMEKIAEGEIEKDKVTDESREMLEDVLRSLKKEKDDISKELRQSLRAQKSIGKCPECGGDLVVRKSKKGRFVGCSNYPECENTYQIPRTGKVVPAHGKCPECGAPKVKVYHKGDTEELCVDLNCKYSRDKRYRGDCPECDGEMREIRSYRAKRFLGCSNYPKCKNTYPLPQSGMIVYEGEVCPECGAPLQKLIKKGKRPWEFCPNPKCSKDKEEE
ncbi:MAG: DNA topoisomerase I [Thermoplasmata archaeon]